MVGSLGNRAIVAYCKPVDMRKGYEGLCGLVQESLSKDPLNGWLYLFVNRTRNRAKVLFFDGTGMCMWAKRLEKGKFVALWKFFDHESIRLTKAELDLFLQGSHLIGRFQVSPPHLREEELRMSS